MPPRKSLNNQRLPNNYKPLPTFQLNDNDEETQNFQELLNAPTWQEAQYRDPYGELPHLSRNFIETTTRPTISSQQTQNPSYQNVAPNSSSPQIQNPSYRNLATTWASQQIQNPSCRNLAPSSSSQQTQKPSYTNFAPNSYSQQTPKPSYSNFTPNSSSRQFQTQSHPNSEPPFTHQIETPSSPIFSQSKCKWDKDEDIALCEIGSNVSDRPKQQRLKSFWTTMETEYNCRMKGRPNAVYRDAKSCSNRWERIKKISIGWKAATAYVRRENNSGQNELDNFTQAKQHYDANNPEKFKHEHIIQHLENFSKYSWTTTDDAFKTYDDVEGFPTTPIGSSQGSHKRASPFDEEDAHIEENVEVSSPAKKLQRPLGAKQQKAKTKVARELYDEKKKANDNLSEARLVEAKAALLRAETADKKANAKVRRLDYQFLKETYDRAKTDEQIEAARKLEDKFNAKWM